MLSSQTLNFRLKALAKNHFKSHSISFSSVVSLSSVSDCSVFICWYRPLGAHSHISERHVFINAKPANPFIVNCRQRLELERRESFGLVCLVNEFQNWSDAQKYSQWIDKLKGWTPDLNSSGAKVTESYTLWVSVCTNLTPVLPSVSCRDGL